MENLDQFCEGLEARIEAAYEKSGNRCGWRLLYSPKKVLKKADIAFIGLNPGSCHPDHAMFDTGNSSAYVKESWADCQPGTSPLQQQVRTLFAKLGAKPEHVLAGNLVPFHSPDWKSLQKPDCSLRFGEELWRDILHRAKPRLVVGMGNDVIPSLCRILDVAMLGSIFINWGNCTAKLARFDGDGLLVVLPHLSHYKIMFREKSAPALRELFQEHWRG